ncbi:hypothetical protein MPTK1_4g00950 [Marchantia polymorpha subsp. ruderalis]
MPFAETYFARPLHEEIMCGFDRLIPHLEHLDIFGTKITRRCSEPPVMLRYFRFQQSSVPFPLSTKFQHQAVLDVNFRMWSAQISIALR